MPPCASPPLQNAPTHFYYIFNSLNTHRETTDLGSVFYSTTIIMYMQFSSISFIYLFISKFLKIHLNGFNFTCLWVCIHLIF
jgi:hypothetical protein